MEHIWDTLKKHPYAIAAGVGAIVLIYLYSGSSSTASAGASGPSDAQLAAATQLQLSNNQLQAASMQVSAGLQAKADELAAGVTVAQLQAGVATYQTQQQANVQGAGIVAQENIALANTSTQQTIADYQLQLGEAQLQAGTEATAIQAATANQLASYNLAGQISSNATLIDLQLINSGNVGGNSGSVDYRASTANLLGAIAASGQTGSGLLPQVQSEVAAGSTWDTILQTVSNWASRTTSSTNAAGKNLILSATAPIYNTTAPISALLPVSV